MASRRIDRGAEIRCHMRDPNGYMIEVSQATGVLEGKLAKKRQKIYPAKAAGQIRISRSRRSAIFRLSPGTHRKYPFGTGRKREQLQVRPLLP